MSPTTALGLVMLGLAAPVIGWACEMGQMILTINGLN